MSRKKILIIIASIILLILIICVGTGFFGSTNNATDVGKDTTIKEESSKDIDEEEPSEKETVNGEILTTTPEHKDTSDALANSESPATDNNSTEEKKEVHVHKWVEKQTVISHPEKGHYEKECVKEAWVEEVPKFEEIAVEVCGNCGAEFTTDPSEHIKEHMLNGTGTKGCRTEYRQVQVGVEQITHDAEYIDKWVVDEKAKEETITTYSCACGATK